MKPSPVFFRLFACCIPVKGYGRSVLYDLQRNAFEHIPNAFFELLRECRSNSMEVLQQLYSKEDFEGISRFLQYLADNEYGFWTSAPEEFPDMSLEWDYPGLLSNAILEYDRSRSAYALEQVLQEAEDLGCRYVQLRVFGDIDHEWLEWIDKLVFTSAIKVVELVIPYWEGMDWDRLFALMKRQHRFIPVSIYGYPRQEPVPGNIATDNFLASRLNITAERLLPGAVPERVHPDTFTVNTDFFCEANSRHTGLNGKVCIDSEGHIRNHITHEAVFGNAGVDPLPEIVATEAFRAKWHLNNDKIEKCKDCEYRYMCPDNGDLEFREDGIHKKRSCSYDPYTCTWLAG